MDRVALIGGLWPLAASCDRTCSMLETYSSITQANYEAGEKNFSAHYTEQVITSKGLTFVQFHSNPKGIDTRNWKVEWLKMNPDGNDYNDDV